MTAYSAELPKLEGECYLPLEEHSVIKVVFSEFPGGLSILSCHCYGSGRYCGTGLDPWPRNFCMLWEQPKVQIHMSKHF